MGGDAQPLEVRRAGPADVPAIARIYNDAVLNTTATFDTEARSIEDRREWLAARGPERPVLVALEAGRVVGWAAVRKTRLRPDG